MNDRNWQMTWSWRMWTFGLVFGPEVYLLCLGPLRFEVLSLKLVSWDDPR